MAFCENCGAPLAEGAKFCGSCGSAVEQIPAVEPRRQSQMSYPESAQGPQPVGYGPQPQETVGNGSKPQPQAAYSQSAHAQPSVGHGPQPPAGSTILQDEDGVYHWVFEYNLWRDPTGFLTVLKAFVGVGIGIMAVSVFFSLINGEFDLDEFVGSLRFGGIFLAVLCGLAIIGYVIYAIMQGGKYCVVFTMSEEGIEHRQMPKQYEKAQVIGALNVALGLATGNVSQVGIGLISGDVPSMESSFPNVRSIQGYPRRGVIKVNEPLAKNQVYVEKSDYAFVYGYIRERCPRAKIRG